VSVSDATKCTNDSAGVTLQVDVLTKVMDQVIIEHQHDCAEECEMMSFGFTQFDLHSKFEIVRASSRLQTTELSQSPVVCLRSFGPDRRVEGGRKIKGKRRQRTRLIGVPL